MDHPAFTAGGLLCEFEHGMRAMKSALRLARGAGTKDLDIGGLHRDALEQNNQQRQFRCRTQSAQRRHRVLLDVPARAPEIHSRAHPRAKIAVPCLAQRDIFLQRDVRKWPIASFRCCAATASL